MDKFQKVLVWLVVVLALGGAGYSQYAISSKIDSVQQSFGGTSGAAADASSVTSSAASDAISNFKFQSNYDTNIYQQQVTALWATKDLLKALADEQARSNAISTAIADEQAESNAIGEAIVASNLIQANAQTTTNWLLFGLLTCIAAFGFATFSAKSKRLDTQIREERLASLRADSDSGEFRWSDLGNK